MSYAFQVKKCRATYQRLMDKVFKDHLRKIIEVYVDDMLVNILEENRIIRDLETQNVINPLKFPFIVKAKKFLGLCLHVEELRLTRTSVKPSCR